MPCAQVLKRRWIQQLPTRAIVRRVPRHQRLRPLRQRHQLECAGHQVMCSMTAAAAAAAAALHQAARFDVLVPTRLLAARLPPALALFPLHDRQAVAYLLQRAGKHRHYSHIIGRVMV